MRVIGIDPASHCGFAWTDGEEPVGHRSGVWDLSLRHYEGGGMRILRFERLLKELLRVSGDRVVFFEEVIWRPKLGKTAAKGDMGPGAAIYGELTGAIMTTCEELSVPYQGIPVSTIKRRATGKGNAKKSAMIAAAQERWGAEIADDNQADAFWVLQCGLDELRA